MARYALAIGVSEYESKRLDNLPKAATDAEKLAQVLEEDGQFQVERLPKRWNEETKNWEVAAKPVTQKELIKGLKTFLWEKAKNSEAIIYFAGHGLRIFDEFEIKEPQGFLTASNCKVRLDGDKLVGEENGIPLDLLNCLIEKSQVSSLVMLLDCCHSGFWLEDDSILQQTFTAFGSQNKNSYLITACRSHENARALKDEKYSIFTGALLKSLSSENAGNDGKITCNSVFHCIDKELKKSGQEPTFLGIGRSITLVEYPEQKHTQPLPRQSTHTKPGIPFQVPPLPAHFVDRPEISQDLTQRLLSENPHHQGTLVISAIHGLGGIGKTVLAQALAYDPHIKERFCDGILWVTLGQEPDLLPLLSGWIEALRDYDYKPTTVKAASDYVRSLLYDKAVLLVVDDAWDVEHVEPFRVGSDKCQVIITTRRADVAEETNAQLYSLDLMSSEQSLALLARRLDRELGEQEKPKARKLAEELGYLPIALDLAAARILRGQTWEQLYQALTAEVARLEVLGGVRRRRKRETRLEASFNLSLNAIREEDAEIWENFIWLGILPEDVSIASPMVATLWQVDMEEAAERLELFWNDALLLPGVPVVINEREWNTYRIHDLLYDLARHWLTRRKQPGLGLDLPDVHHQFLERYQANLTDGLWHHLPDDGYIHNHLTWHMEKAGETEVIHQLLKEETGSGRNGWYLACEKLGKTAVFITDVARGWQFAEEEFDSAPTKAISLQCRYALITSSLNTIAANIPSELIVALVENKTWSIAQGLAYTRQVQDFNQRAEVLREIAPHLPEIWSEALAVVRGMGNEKYRVEMLREIAPHLPENLLPEALAVVRGIGDEKYRVEALREIAPHLPEIWPEALAAVRGIGNEKYRVEALREIAPHLPENLLSEALAVARGMGNEKYRVEALKEIVHAIYQISSSFPYTLWREILHCFSSLKRRELLEKIKEHTEVIQQLGGAETFKEMAHAINDVGKWFP